jgi:hypothetical protein
MIRFQRSLRAIGGKGREAVAWAQELTTYLNSKFGETNLQVFTQRFGDINTIAWQADFDSLASLNNYQQAVNVDTGYWELVDKTDGLFVDGSIHDTVFESL